MPFRFVMMAPYSQEGEPPAIPGRFTDLLSLGFAVFYLNRTNRSGILNGGIIGGRAQTGQWKLDARFNKADLINKIVRIGDLRQRITLTNLDAVAFLRNRAAHWNNKTLVYLDPPYFVKGGQLYYDFYRPEDHRAVAETVSAVLKGTNWIVSYDDVLPIGELYHEATSLRYTIGYSARERSIGQEAMFFSPSLNVPEAAGAMKEVSRKLAVEG